METVIENFNERVTEIEEYLKLLEFISQPDAKIHCAQSRPKTVSQTAIKTMKASCFLMFYNLIESSIRDSMEKLYEHINSENKGLINFDECVKQIWVEQKFKNMDPFSSNHTSYKNLIKEMVNDILLTSPVLLDAEKVQISGNLDAREIRRIFALHKIPVNTHYRALGGGELKTVKDKRNSLAHGSESFSECGQGYTVQTLIDIKKQTVVFLRSSLRNVKKYIESRKYAAA